MKRILCATDFSDCGFKALDYAIDLVEPMEARLDVIYVLPSDKSGAGRGPDLESQVVETHLRDDVQSFLDTRYSTTTDLPEIHCAVIRSKKVASAIIDYAIEIGADMIVLGTRGKGEIKRFFLGSVAAEVVRTAPCPVLTVQKDAELSPIQRILVPVDFSEDTRETLREARALAALFDAHLELLHTVLDPQPPDFYEDESSWLNDVDSHTSELAENKLKKEFRAVGGREVAVRFHVRNGHPAKEIVRFVNEQSCDLIVMSTRGLQGFMRFLLGSMTEAVMRKAPCPILTVKVPEKGHKEALHMGQNRD